MGLIYCTGCSHEQHGGNVVSARTVAFVNRTGVVNHIWLMDVDGPGIGRNARRVTSDSAAENYPTWSPDGQRLVYQRDYDGSAIYVMDADGKNEQRLSPTPGFDVTPSWSPDGTKIIYTRVLALIVAGQVPKTEIHVMNADGSGDQIILPASDFSVEPRWSLHNQVVFMSLINGSQQIFVMNIDGTGVKQLTNEADNGDPVWSPDGSRISFGSDREGGGKLNIFIMNADGSNVRQLTHFLVPVESGDTNWSSDGTEIIFEYDIDGQHQSNPSAYAEVWTMKADGTWAVSTKQPCSGVGCSPRWRPN